MASTQSPNGGLSFFGVLALIFITLKLTGNIDWVVLSPAWLPFATVVIIIAALLASWR